MTILSSHIFPYLLLITLLAVGAAFFRRVLLKILFLLAVEILLFLFFPQLLLALANLVGLIRGNLA